MYGTVARTRVKPENRDALMKVFQDDAPSGTAEGFIGAYTLFENDSDVMWMFAVFSDRAAYQANADDPRQHEQYVAYRALMEEDPQWHDGEIQGM
jgi:quinol monooxygenase YgiN